MDVAIDAMIMKAAATNRSAMPAGMVKKPAKQRIALASATATMIQATIEAISQAW
jgi:hypothetical protein